MHDGGTSRSIGWASADGGEVYVVALDGGRGSRRRWSLREPKESWPWCQPTTFAVGKGRGVDAPCAKGSPPVMHTEPVRPVRVFILLFRPVNAIDDARLPHRRIPRLALVGREHSRVIRTDEHARLLRERDEVGAVHMASLPLAALPVERIHVERELLKLLDALVGDGDLSDPRGWGKGRRAMNAKVLEGHADPRGKDAELDPGEGVVAPDGRAVAEDERRGRLVEVADRAGRVVERTQVRRQGRGQVVVGRLTGRRDDRERTARGK